MHEPRVLLDGLAYVESARWHDGRLWFAHWGTDEIIAVDLDGNSEVVGHGPGGPGWSIDWLPDGRLLTTGERLMRHEPDGSPGGEIMSTAFSRIGEGGTLTDTVQLDRSPFACMLGGPDGRTLFILAAEWRGFEEIEAAIADRTGLVLVVDAPAPHAGWP